jgi:flagellar hook-length control protein FliK
MASVPNLPIAPAVPTPGATGTPDAEGLGLDFFAQLLSGGPAMAVIAGQASTPAGEVTLRAAPTDGDAEAADGEATTPDGSGTADIIPLLQAQSGFPVAVVPAAPAATPAPAEAVPAPQKGAKPPIQAATIQAAPAEPAIKPADGDDIGGSELVDAAIKAMAEKIVGKPAARTEKPGRAAPSAPSQTAPAEPTAMTTQPRAAEAVVARIETAIQPAAPNAATFTTVPVTLQPVSPAAASVQSAVPDVAQLIAEKQLDLVNDNQWLDRLARDIARAGASDEPLRFRLHPQTLGHLQVELTQSERGATVRLTVETEAARNILVDAQPRLAAEARAQGVRLAGTEVDLGSAGQHSGDARRNAEERPQDIVRVVRAGQTASTPSEPAEGRSDRYA